MLVEKASKVQFISKKPITRQIARRRDDQIERYFKLRNGVLLMGEKDLLEELGSMTDKEFEMYVNKKHNDFESWLAMNNKVELAAKISQCNTRREMIAALSRTKEKDPIAIGVKVTKRVKVEEKATEKAKEAVLESTATNVESESKDKKKKE
jgi:hypothetical protein